MGKKNKALHTPAAPDGPIVHDNGEKSSAKNQEAAGEQSSGKDKHVLKGQKRPHHEQAKQTKRPRVDKGKKDDKAKDEDGSGDEEESGSKIVMDDGMKAMRKADKKERKWAQSSIKKAIKQKDIKYFNKLISQLGTSKQLGFAFQVYSVHFTSFSV